VINRHFKREAKIMIWLALLPIIIGILAAFVLPWISVSLEVDSCLDSGGSHDYEKCICDHEENHEFKENNKCN
jgi:hypothetical protein